MIKESICHLEQLRCKNGLFLASKKGVSTGYDKAWIRDNLYAMMGYELINPDKAVKTIHALLDVLLKHEYKIDWAVKKKPEHTYEYIHARYNPENFDEFWEEWGNKQNDAIGLFLFKIGDMTLKGLRIFRDNNDFRIIQKLINYLMSVEYWHDEDNGIWEEYAEVHASSIGACLAGLKKIKKAGFEVPDFMINYGEESLKNLLPRESATKKVDLALLSLIYPYEIVDEKMRCIILENVEKILLRNNGVIRYLNDQYYHNGLGEARWTMGLPWLAIIHRIIGSTEKYKHYLKLTLEAMNDNLELPELYYAYSSKHNENTPLGWAQSLLITALLGSNVYLMSD